MSHSSLAHIIMSVLRWSFHRELWTRARCWVIIWGSKSQRPAERSKWTESWSGIDLHSVMFNCVTQAEFLSELILKLCMFIGLYFIWIIRPQIVYWVFWNIPTTYQLINWLFVQFLYIHCWIAYFLNIVEYYLNTVESLLNIFKKRFIKWLT